MKYLLKNTILGDDSNIRKSQFLPRVAHKKIKGLLCTLIFETNTTNDMN